ncbi:MAG: methyltransferase domain-containing protein [Chrysiogenales bacterium]|nr:methyltransferase domain-containing protein [Candidatus Aminicenantes bacterium]TFG74343.1 MAG: methyltransferase domain-containing protein [Chrysiogenales bacterium]
MPKKVEEIGRVRRSKEDARASYNRMSKWYDAVAGSSEKKFGDAALRKLNAKAGERILEIGFGTGHGILALARAVGDSGRIYGIDISEGMLEITRSRLRKSGLLERVDLERGDASSLLYPADFFDAVFMSFTLELFDTAEIQAVLHQCRRVLKPGGRLCVVAMSKEGKSGVMMKLYEWGHKKFPSYLDCRPIFVRQAIESAGFEIADMARMTSWGLPIGIAVARKNREE